jgi:hypothetical protein
MHTNRQHKHSHLFTVRLWAEDTGDGQAEWRGKIYCVDTGESRYFRDWPALLPVLLAMLREAEAASLSDPPQPGEPAGGDEE